MFALTLNAASGVVRRGGMKDAMESTNDDGVAAAILKGLLAGVAGVAAMTAAEKVEQALTGRPNSYVPAHTLQRLLGRSDQDRLATNWTMHWGQGIALGAVRALMSRQGIRGPVGSFMFLNLRLLNDQTLENATGAGAPPWTWPVNEQVIDLLHKGVYAIVTGVISDRLVGRKAERDDRQQRHA
jgi:hypothetical protein